MNHVRRPRFPNFSRPAVHKGLFEVAPLAEQDFTTAGMLGKMALATHLPGPGDHGFIGCWLLCRSDARGLFRTTC